MSFEHVFNPYDHDVIYGISDRRDDYIERYIRYRMSSWDPDDDGPIELHRKIIEKLATNYSLINQYNEPILNVNFLTKPPYPIYASILNPRVGGYLDSLKRTRYAIERVREASVAKLAKGNVAISPANIRSLPKQDLRAAATILAIRRACKFGIEYVSQAALSGSVHYVLDGITISDVIGKTARPLWAGSTGVPITTSELRYLFRNWYRLKDVAKSGRIRFWRNYAPFDAPWETSPKEWVGYAAERLKKRKAALTTHAGLIDTFEKFSAIDPVMALDVFFKIPSGDTLLVEG